MRVGMKLTRTASSTLDVGSVIAAATNPRRFRLYDCVAGSDAAAADNPFLWEFYKRTGTATGGASGSGANAIDISDTIASTLVTNQGPTTNGAGGSTPLYGFPLNQRATYRWIAQPFSELVAPATASNGFGVATPTASAVAVEAYLLLDEI